MKTGKPIIASLYDPIVRSALVPQLFIGFLALLMLDGGIMAKVVGVAVLAFWLCAGVLMVRRPMAPTQFDLAFVKYGFWIVLAVAAFRQFNA